MPKKTNSTAAPRRDVKRMTVEVREGGSKVVDPKSGKVVETTKDKTEGDDNA